MIKGVHTMFYSSQPEEFRAFIRDKLGFSGIDIGDGWLIFDVPEADMGCHPSDDGAPSGRHDISFYCDDIEKTVAELRARGVEFVDEVSDRGYGLVTHFRVPGGFVLQLYQPRYVKSAGGRLIDGASPAAPAVVPAGSIILAGMTEQPKPPGTPHVEPEPSSRGVLARLALLALTVLPGCGVGVQPLMPTPVLYTDGGIEPLAHIPEKERWRARRVYYATDRARDANKQEISYGNRPSDDLSLGLALIGFGGESLTWADLRRSSNQAEREGVIDLSINGIVEVGRFDIDAPLAEAAGPDAAGLLLRDLNNAIEDARENDVLVYVHGAKVNFYNGCAFAAQLDHFMGRDMTSLAFNWPTRQDVFSYAFGGDRERAYDSARALASLLELLASETSAGQIHVLSWSAGARVVTEALVIMRQRHAEISEEALREQFRLGTIYYAAGDVPTDEFLLAAPTLHALSKRLVVTTSSDDAALQSASALMGEGGRIGQTGNDLSQDERDMLESMERLEIIGVSLGGDRRGFDIDGHRYWFDHPWASSDVLLAIRTDLSPAERGLEQGESPVVWFMPADYPQRLRDRIRRSANTGW